MSQIDRIITTLEGLTSDGELAQVVADAVERRCAQLLARPEIQSGAQSLMAKYVMDTIVDSTQSILGSGGGLSQIHTVIEDAYRHGLEDGLAIGVEACPERSFEVG